jgi:hypothetical protein
MTTTSAFTRPVPVSLSSTGPGDEGETAVRVIPGIQGGAPGAPIGQGTPNHLGATPNDRIKALTRAILPNIYAETR